MADASGSVNGGRSSGTPMDMAEVDSALQRHSDGGASSTQEDVYLTDKLPHNLPLDALPYVDPLPADQQQEVQQLLQQEMTAIAQESAGQNPPDYLKDFPLPATPILDDAESMLGKEMARKAKGDPIPELDLSMYSSFSRPSGPKASDVKEWEKCVSQCQKLLQHAAVAHLNLELMNSHAAASWNRHLTNLSQTKDRFFAAVKRRAEDSDSICKARKVEQVEAAATLKQLEQTAGQYRENNATIIEALGPLTAEVIDLKAKCRVRGILPEYAEEDEFDLEAWREAAGTKA